MPKKTMNEDRSVAEVLAEMTGRPVEAFQADDGLEYPEPDELESVNDN